MLPRTALLSLLLCTAALAASQPLWRPPRRGAPVAAARPAADGAERRGLQQLRQAIRGAAAAPPANSTAGGTPPPRLLAVVARYADDISWLVEGGKPLGGLDIEVWQSADIDPFPGSTNAIFPGLPATVDDVERVLPGWPEWALDYVAEKNATKLLAPVGTAADAERAARAAAGLPPSARGPPPPPPERAPWAPRGGDASARRAPVAVVPEVSPVLPLRVAPNRGAEAMSIVSAIIEHYEDLPDLMLFMHGHRLGWHTVLPQDWTLKMIASRPPSPSLSRGYMPLHCLAPVGDDNTPPFAKTLLFLHVVDANHRDADGPCAVGGALPCLAAHVVQAWREFFGEALGLELPAYVRTTHGSTFVASRDAIRRHGKSFYEDLRQWLLFTPMDGKWAGTVLEYLWALVLTGSPDVDPSVAECQCVLFHLCEEEGPA